MSDFVSEICGVDGAALKPRYCLSCGGNDANVPCAYPSEGMNGCLRDKRLRQEFGDAFTDDCIKQRADRGHV